MESRHSNDNSPGNKTIKRARSKKGFTPRELIHYHIDNPDEPIEDEDMENLVLQVVPNIPDPNELLDVKADAADNRMPGNKE